MTAGVNHGMHEIHGKIPVPGSIAAVCDRRAHGIRQGTAA